MATLSLELLRSFVAVSELGSFSKASHALGRTQPAVSLQIKRLEDAVGARLLHRGGREVALTETGKVLVQYARQMLFLNDEALSRLSRTKVQGNIRVGLPNDFAVTFLPEILGSFAEGYAGVSLEVGSAISRKLLEGLRAGQFDLVVAMTGESSLLMPVKEWTERLVWVGAENMGRRSPLPLVAYPEGCTYRQRMVDALNRANRDWRLAYTSDSISGIAAAVRAGLGISVLSERTVPSGLDVLDARLGLPGLMDVTVGLHCASARSSSAVSHLVNHISGCLDRGHAKRAAGAGDRCP